MGVGDRREKPAIRFQPSFVGGKRMTKAFDHQNRLPLPPLSRRQILRPRLGRSRLGPAKDSFPKTIINNHQFQSGLVLTGSNSGGRMDDTEWDWERIDSSAKDRESE